HHRWFSYLSSLKNYSSTLIYTLSLHDALPIYGELVGELVALVKEGPKAEIISLKKGARKLFVIESKSLAHALAYEKLIQNGYRRSEEHTSELQSRSDLVCRLLLEKKKVV